MTCGKNIDFKRACREALETAKARGQGDALKHCAGEVVEAAAARAAFLEKMRFCTDNPKDDFCSECDGESFCDAARQFQDELADIVICAMSEWAARFGGADFADAIRRKMAENKRRADCEAKKSDPETSSLRRLRTG